MNGREQQSMLPLFNLNCLKLIKNDPAQWLKGGHR
jgi:hypothetical protein